MLDWVTEECFKTENFLEYSILVTFPKSKTLWKFFRGVLPGRSIWSALNKTESKTLIKSEKLLPLFIWKDRNFGNASGKVSIKPDGTNAQSCRIDWKLRVLLRHENSIAIKFQNASTESSCQVSAPTDVNLLYLTSTPFPKLDPGLRVPNPMLRTSRLLPKVQDPLARVGVIVWEGESNLDCMRIISKDHSNIVHHSFQTCPRCCDFRKTSTWTSKQFDL